MTLSPFRPSSFGVASKPETLPRYFCLAARVSPSSDTSSQVSLSIARIIESWYLNPHTNVLTTLTTLPKPDQSSLCSLSAFVLGLATFGRLGDRIGPRKRGWLFAGTLIQAILTLASALTFWALETRVNNNVLYFFGVACLSASLGVQGIMARRLNTQFSTTSEWLAFLPRRLCSVPYVSFYYSVVLTAVFVELVTDPTLFQVTRPVRSRDQKWLAVAALFLGVVVGRLILGQLGTALTIGVGVLIRVGIAVSWLCIPATRVHLP